MTTVQTASRPHVPFKQEVSIQTLFMCKEGFDLYKCDECQHIFLVVDPSIEALKRVYSFANSYQVQDRKILTKIQILVRRCAKALNKWRIFARAEGDSGCGCSQESSYGSPDEMDGRLLVWN